jgi:hypothetical protein
VTDAVTAGASACIHSVPSAHVESVSVPTASARLLRMDGGGVVEGVEGVEGVEEVEEGAGVDCTAVAPEAAWRGDARRS